MAAPICRRANICRTPTALPGDGAVAAVTSQPYAIVTNPNRPTVDASTLGLSSAKQVESSPTSYTGIAGSSQGNCQPILRAAGQRAPITIPARSARPTDSNFTCTIGWANQFTSAYQYTCHTSEWDIYNPNTGGTFYWGEVSDCGSFASQSSCTQVSQTKSPRSRPGRPARAWHGLHRDRHDLQLRRADQLWGQRVEDYCINHTTLCFEPPPQDQAPGVPGAAYVGPIQTYQGSTVDNADCQAKLKACRLARPACNPRKSAWMHRPPPAPSTASRSPMIAGSGRRPTSAARSSANDCATLSAKSNCSFDHEVCLDSPHGRLSGQERGLQMHDACHDADSPAYSCSGDVYCIDGSCTQLPTSPAPDLANALVAMNAMKDADQQFDANNLTIFDGDATGCHKPLFGLVNCCAGKVSGLLTGAAAASAAIGLASGNPAMLLGL
jgi:conjugal transfer mating pair stabilization protein TraN